MCKLCTSVDIQSLTWETVSNDESGRPRFWADGAVIPVDDNSFAYWTFGGLQSAEQTICDVDMYNLSTFNHVVAIDCFSSLR